MYDFLDDAVFPDFRRFALTDIEPYRKIYEKFYIPYADISPANLLVWFDINHTLEISCLDEALILRYDNPFDNHEKNYIVLEQEVSEAHIELIYKLPGKKNTVRIKEEPANITKSLTSSKTLSLIDNVDSYEYILDNKLLSELKGGPISRLREEVNHFQKNNQLISLEHLKTFDSSKKAFLHKVVDSWSLTAHPNTKNKVTNLERIALKTAIEHIDILRREVVIIYVNQQPVGLAIYSVYGDIAIIGHVKVDYTFKSAFSYTTHRLAKLLFERHILYMNFEQDLGIDGLRHHKTLLRPIKKLEKVDIALLDSKSQLSDT